MNAIVAVDENWAIGNNNQLLYKIPHDMDMFVARTTHSVIVMGRKTLESFPNRKPLKYRTNIVLTRDPNYEVDGAIVLHSIDELKEELKKYDSNEIYVIGGGEIYSQLIDMCDTAYVTKIFDRVEETDTWFSNLDDIKKWKITEKSQLMVHEGVWYQFLTYTNTNVKND